MVRINQDELALDSDDEDYPGQNDEQRRHRVIRHAIDAAMQIISDGSNGDVEETNYLESAVAHEFSATVHGHFQAALLKNDLEKRHGQQK